MSRRAYKLRNPARKFRQLSQLDRDNTKSMTKLYFDGFALWEIARGFPYTKEQIAHNIALLCGLNKGQEKSMAWNDGPRARHRAAKARRVQTPPATSVINSAPQASPGRSDSAC
jgi:hypothetical protein